MSNELKRLQELKRLDDLKRLRDEEQRLNEELAGEYEVAFAQLEKIAADREDVDLMQLVQVLRPMAVANKRDPFRQTAAATMLQVVSIYLLGGQAVGRALEFTQMLLRQVTGAGKEG